MKYINSILLLTSLALTSMSGATQETRYGPQNTETTTILGSEMANIRASGAQLDSQIKTAKEKLEVVAKMNSENERESQVDDLFITLREEIYSVLDRLDSNSEFADALNRAKEGAIVLKSWFERQPPDYPNRDQNIDQLDQLIQEFDNVDNQLAESRRIAQEKLSTIIRQHHVTVQQMKIGKVMEALTAARTVVEGLNEVTRAMTVVEEKTNASLKVSVSISN